MGLRFRGIQGTTEVPIVSANDHIEIHKAFTGLRDLVSRPARRKRISTSTRVLTQQTDKVEEL